MHTTRAKPTSAVPTRGAFVQGVRAITPMVIGLVPFGIAIGSASATLDVDRTAAWAGSWLVLAGAAQLAVMQLIDEGAAPFVVISAALMINARFVVYSAGLAEWFPSATRKTRLLLAIPVVDQLYITAVARFEQLDLCEEDRRRFYAGAAVHLASAWVVAQTIGVVVGDQLPTAIGLHHVSLLALAGLLARALTTRAARVAAGVAAVTALAGADLPYHSVILVAMLAGMAAAAPREPAVTTWLVFLAVAAGTYAIRASMLVGLAGRRLPIVVQSRLALAGPAAIATLVMSSLFSGSGGARWPELIAGTAGFLAVRHTGNVTHAFLVGMPMLWIFYALGL